MPKLILAALTLIGFALVLGVIAYTLIEDQSLKLAIIMVAVFDMIAATFLVAKAFRQQK